MFELDNDEEELVVPVENAIVPAVNPFELFVNAPTPLFNCCPLFIPPLPKPLFNKGIPPFIMGFIPILLLCEFINPVVVLLLNAFPPNTCPPPPPKGLPTVTTADGAPDDSNNKRN